jgi:hypothetical protein
MSYLAFFTPHNLALLNDWLSETGELYVDVYLPHSGGSSVAYFIHSLKELKSLISQQTWPEISFTVFKQLQFPLRGKADENLLEQALNRIPDGQPYSIVSIPLSRYPSNISWQGNGNSHEELRREFADVLGEEVGIGQEPFDIYDDKWIRYHHEVFQVSLTKNQNYYEPYAKEPERYKWLEDFWRE